MRTICLNVFFFTATIVTMMKGPFPLESICHGSSMIQCNSGGTDTVLADGYLHKPDGTLATLSGIGAFLDIVFEPNTNNLDVGGGKGDAISAYLLKERKVTNYVYDPYNRSKQHNDRILGLAAKGNFDSATSMSVLNVIDNRDARMKHIQLMHSALKPGGKAYFKVYRGDNSGRELLDPQHNRYQSNRGVKTYLDEVTEIFGKDVTVDKDRNLIIAIKAIKK
jgi:SAM-dependent methyltransferase